MILREVMLANFRQFAGEQTLTFSVDPEKNVTVLKVVAGLAALLFVLIGLFAVIGGVLGFVQRARHGPTRRHEGLAQPGIEEHDEEGN